MLSGSRYLIGFFEVCVASGLREHYEVARGWESPNVVVDMSERIL